MSVQNPERVVTKQDLADFYEQILPYLGGMPEILANKISKGDMYSTDERIIGQWIDGKPLYQKTIYFGALPNKTTKQVAHGIANIGKVISIVGTAASDTYTTSIPKITDIPSTSTANQQAAVFVTSTVIAVDGRYADSSAYTDCYITIQYTKTTDSAVSIGNDTDYSTTEKIVGTWIDGSPIWQKTVDFGSLPNATSKSVAHNISDIAFITNYYGITTNGNAFMTLPKSVPSDGNLAGIGIVCNKTQVEITAGTDRSSYTNTYITIQYVKATS